MKYALVTGGTRGIGRAISIKLAQKGIFVLINYKSNKDAAQETMRLIEKAGNKVDIVQFDISNEDEVKESLKSWNLSHPDDYISILINNAGICSDKILPFMGSEQWRHVIDTNLNGFFYVTRELISEMYTNNFGRIINISSVSALKGVIGQTNYSAAKAGLMGASKSLALEVASRNITVNTIAPGYIDSDMLVGLDIKKIIKQIPSKRLGRPEEVAHLVAFLVSAKASYITGENLIIDGGLSI